MTNLLDTNIAELSNFCSGNHPNTKDRIKHYTNATQQKVLKISQDASLQWTRTRHMNRESTNPCENAIFQVIIVTPVINLGSGATYFKNINGQFTSAKTGKHSIFPKDSFKEVTSE